MRQVGFYGNGYVIFDGVSLGKEEADISLSFFTKQPSALLLLGRDVNSDVSPSSICFCSYLGRWLVGW